MANVGLCELCPLDSYKANIGSWYVHYVVQPPSLRCEADASCVHVHNVCDVCDVREGFFQRLAVRLKCQVGWRLTLNLSILHVCEFRADAA